MTGRAWISILLSAALLASQTGCAASRSQTRTLHIPQPGPGLSAITALGPTGISVVWGAPEAGIAEPPSGWLAGAGRGAAVGAFVTGLGGAAGGWETVKGRGCTGDCGFEAAWLLAWTAVGLALWPVGAAVGAVVGAVKAPPAEQVRRAQAALIDAVAAAELPRTIRDETIRLGSERSWHTLVPITGQGPEAGEHAVGTVLEILIRHVGLERRATPSAPEDDWLDTDPELELRLDVNARLVRASDGTVLYADSFQEVGPSRKFSVWAADDGRAFRDGLGWVAEHVADRIAWAVFSPPHPLLGSWRGGWNRNDLQGDLEFTVTRVEGERVEGIAVIHGTMPYHNQALPFTGRLEGQALTGQIPTSARTSILWILDLSPDDRYLTGKGLQGRVWSVLTLEKAR